MTGERRSTPGLTLATLGSIGLVISLWQPWYTFRFPSSVLDQVQQRASQYGVLGPLINQGAEIIRRLGTFHVTAWQAYTVIPALLLVVGVLAGGLSLLMLSDRASDVAGVVAKIGLVGIAGTVYRMVALPEHSDLFHIAWGMYLALGSAVAIVVGGAIAAAGEAGESPIPVITGVSDVAPASAAAWPSAGSVAPPGS